MEVVTATVAIVLDKYKSCCTFRELVSSALANCEAVFPYFPCFPELAPAVFVFLGFGKEKRGRRARKHVVKRGGEKG